MTDNGPKSDAKRVGIYVRVSTDKQSTDMQIADLKKYCELRKWDISGIYEDKLSGTKENRPALNELMNKAKRREIDIVLTWKLDRFGRSLKHLVTGIAELTELGVAFVSLQDNLDFTTSAGRFQAQILAAVAEFEASMIRERVRRGLAMAKEKGVVLGRRRTISVEVARKLKLAGRSYREIADIMGCSRVGVIKSLRNAMS